MLAQEYRSFAVILVDDCSTDDTAAVAERWAQRDGRIAFRRNARRLGLVGNWRRCFEVARELFPQAEYFAWGSDHDWWAPRWLASLASALDESAAAVLAFPQPYALAEDGELAKLGGGVDTSGLREPGRRMGAMSTSGGAGFMVYGLFRTRALERAGPFPGVLAPDKLLLVRLSLVGTFVRVDEVLWHRSKIERGRLPRHQRATLFPGRAPWHAWLPVWVVHGVALFVQLGLGRGRPEISRRRGMGYGLLYPIDRLRHSIRRHQRHLEGRGRRLRRRFRRGPGRSVRNLRRRLRRGWEVVQGLARSLRGLG